MTCIEFKCKLCKQYSSIELGDSVFLSLDHLEHIVIDTSLELDNQGYLTIGFKINKQWKTKSNESNTM